MARENSGAVTLQLTGDEALVPFEFLQKFGETGKLAIADQAEERALLKVCGMLERCLSEPFSGDYAQLHAQARARLLDR